MLFGWTWMDKIELWLDLILNDDKFICYNLLWFISSCIENELFAEERRKLNRLYFSSHASYASDRQFCNSPHTCTGMLIAHWSHCGIVYLCQFRHRGMPSIPKCINPEYRTCPTECIQHIPHPLLCKSSIVDAFKSKKKKTFCLLYFFMIRMTKNNMLQCRMHYIQIHFSLTVCKNCIEFSYGWEWRERRQKTKLKDVRNFLFQKNALGKIIVSESVWNKSFDLVWLIFVLSNAWIETKKVHTYLVMWLMNIPYVNCLFSFSN